jgi:hypothetical protein
MADARDQDCRDPRVGVYRQGTESGIVRFCFAKKDNNTLGRALDRLAE